MSCTIALIRKPTADNAFAYSIAARIQNEYKAALGLIIILAGYLRLTP